jgi:SAM-dependent methyltransferase
MNPVPILAGLTTYIPALHRRLSRLAADPPKSAYYYYGAWLRHLTVLTRHGLPGPPASLAELGPGDCLGMGIAAILSGTSRYMALDVVRLAHPEKNLTVFEEMVRLFSARTPRAASDWPGREALGDDKGFPGHILTRERLAASLAPGRLEAIRQAILHGRSGDGGIVISYHAPYDDPDVAPPDSVDAVISQAVLEHVADPASVHANLLRWLVPGGLASHHVDLKCHGMSRSWNGHLAYPPFWWRLAMGRKPYLLNRLSCSEQLTRLEDSGFEIVAAFKARRDDGLPRHKLARQFRGLSDEDLCCPNLFVLARKPAQSSSP